MMDWYCNPIQSEVQSDKNLLFWIGSIGWIELVSILNTPNYNYRTMATDRLLFMGQSNSLEV